MSSSPQDTFVPGYELFEVIGQGGMGVVHRARDQRLDRDVAVKLLADSTSTPAAAARFLVEAKITGQLQHPGIPAVYELGTLTDGRPFLAMKLVKGQTLQRLLEGPPPITPDSSPHGEKGSPSRSHFIAIFEQICQAVSCAHAHNVIHRDLKPANVMVGAFGEVQVMDWGLAKVLGDGSPDPAGPHGELGEDPLATVDARSVLDTTQRADSATRTGSFLGTPAYVAPEQAGGEIRKLDSRSDVFGLGAILCQILTGRPPYQGANAHDVRLLAVRGEMTEARAALAACAAEPDLVALCIRCLAFRQEDRPADGGVVASAVAALRTAAEARARQAELDRTRAEINAAELRRRKRGVQVAAAIVATVLGAGIISTSAGLVWAVRERNDKALALDAETKARAAEKQARDQALAALRDVTNDVVENQMARGETLPAENKEFLRKLIKHYEGLAAVTGDDAESRDIRGEGYARVGTMRHGLGELAEAEAAYANALAVRKQLVVDFPNRPNLRQDLAASHNNLGFLFHNTGRLKEAENAFAEAVATLRQLTAEYPDRSEFQRDLAKNHDARGTLLRDVGRLPGAEAAYAESLAMRERLAARFPARTELRQELAMSHNNLAALYHHTSQRAAAEAAYNKALATFQQLAAEHPENPDFRQALATTHHNLGLLYRVLGQLDKTEVAITEALALRKQLAADYPTRPKFRQDLAASHNAMALLLNASGHRKEAEAAHNAALVIRRRLVIDFPTRPEFRHQLASSLNNLGTLLRGWGRIEEAATIQAEALTIRKQLAADFPNQPEVRNSLAGTFVNLAILCNKRREHAAAKAYLHEATPHHEAALKASPAHPDYRQFYKNNLAELTQTNAYLGDLLGAKQAADKLRDLGWDPPGHALDAAGQLAQCIPITANDQQQAQFYADAAMQMLRDAVARGFRDVAQLKQTKDLDPLREREEFKKFLAELESK